MVKINSVLTKTKSPWQVNLKNRTGVIKHDVGDGFYLIQFPFFKPYGKKDLEWYVHQNDFSHGN